MLKSFFNHNMMLDFYYTKEPEKFYYELDDSYFDIKFQYSKKDDNFLIHVLYKQ